MISRKQAAAIARAEAITKGLGTDLSEVLKPSEITFAPPRLYGIDLSGCWIAYFTSEFPFRICASTIVVIDQETGRIVYTGSANDEG